EVCWLNYYQRCCFVTSTCDRCTETWIQSRQSCSTSEKSLHSKTADELANPCCQFC
ncbi:hypothetical protein LSH36_457g01006, partial [Paralvinella palmiformis]